MAKWKTLVVMFLTMMILLNVTLEKTNAEDIQATVDTVESQIERMQVSNEVLRTLSTEEVVQLALNYPLLVDCFLYDDATQAMMYLSRTSNVFHELFNRGDANSKLLKAYDSLIVNYKKMIDDGLDFIESKYIQEYFFQRYFATVKSQLSDAEQIYLESIVEDKYQRKIGICDDYLTAYQFYYDERNVNNSNQAIISSRSNNSLLSSVSYTAGFTYLGGTLTRGLAQYYIGTYGKYNVSAYCLRHKSGDYTSSEKSAVDASILSAHSSWSLLSSATVKYNCHSYAWIQTSSSNVYWLDSPTTFAGSSAIRHIGSNCGVTTNDKIVIFDISGALNHSAIIYNNSSMTCSKMGSAGVYLISLMDVVLYYGCDYEVYRER